MKTPEKIWAQAETMGRNFFEPYGRWAVSPRKPDPYFPMEAVQYTRTDAILEDPRVKALVEALDGSIETAAMVAKDLRGKSLCQYEHNASSLEANNRCARAALAAIKGATHDRPRR